MARSPDHFYIRWKHPTLLVQNRKDLLDLKSRELPLCPLCTAKEMEYNQSILDFLKHSKRHPLKTLDLFAGVGAFSLGLEKGSGCLKLTHAIEISPSASATIRFVIFFPLSLPTDAMQAEFP